MNGTLKVYYQCLSCNVKDFLMGKGLRYLVRCRHFDTKCPMWIFMYDKEGLLDKYLEEWKSVRKLNYKKD